jgi:hypothetical protein
MRASSQTGWAKARTPAASRAVVVAAALELLVLDSSSPVPNEGRRLLVIDSALSRWIPSDGAACVGQTGERGARLPSLHLAQGSERRAELF